jgi:2'-5' RNA ligase
VIRLFAALAIPPAVAERLAGLQRGLDGRPTAPENFHVTLQFFGEIAETAAADLHAELGAVEAPAFSFQLDGVGAFGGAKPRALWVGVRPEPALTLLQAKVAQAGRRAGLSLPAEKFTPHVTLARFAPGELSPAAAAKALEARAAFLAGPVAAAWFALYRSDLGRRGPIYTELARYPLRG